MRRLVIVVVLVLWGAHLSAQAVTVTYTLTAAEKAAVTALIVPLNEFITAFNAVCVPQPSCQQTAWTIQSYADAQVRDLFKNRLDEAVEKRAARVKEKYKQATPSQQNAAEAALPPE